MAAHEAVARAWRNGRTLKGSRVPEISWRVRWTDTVQNMANAEGMYRMSTDGYNLYSYDMLIGITLADGTKVALEAPQKRVSVATQNHMRIAQASAHRTVNGVDVGDWHGDFNHYAFPTEILAQAVYVHSYAESLYFASA